MLKSKKMQNVYLAQIPYQFESTKTIYFPYSVGMLWSYAQTKQIIKENYKLKKFIFIREPIEEILSTFVDPDVVALSCYTWNINFSMELAREIKLRWPRCFIIAGGPQIAERHVNLYQTYPFLDVAIYREGERSFADILSARALGKGLSLIPGISFNNNGKFFKTLDPIRIKNVNEIPSPYLDGYFKDVVIEANNKGYILNLLLETNRGCPYECTFCDWGNGVLGKVEKFDLHRVKKELLWAAKNKIEFINNCDANFGIYKQRDLEITKFIARLKKRYGYPKTFDVSWLKNSTSEAIDMAKILLNNGLLRRFTASIQSKHEPTLKAIKRINPKEAHTNQIVAEAKSKGIAVNAEFIIGMPLETFDSFRSAFCEIIEQDIYPSTSFLTLLPGSEMADPEYKIKYGFKTKVITNRLPIVAEEDEVVIATNTMPVQEMEKLILWVWFVQQFHLHGYTHVIYDFFAKRYNYNLEKFYDEFISISLENKKTMLCEILSPYEHHIEDGLTAQLELGINMADLHTIIGCYKRQEFYQDLRQIIKNMIKKEDVTVLDDLIKLQDHSQLNSYRSTHSNFQIDSNLYEYIYQDEKLTHKKMEYTVSQIEDIAKDNQFGYFMVTLRYLKKWKTVIKNIV